MQFSGDPELNIEGTDPTLGAAFGQAALAMMAAITDPAAVRHEETVEIDCTASSAELLLADWLNAVISKITEHGMVFGAFNVDTDGFQLHATAIGEHVSQERHAPAIQIKGGTRTAMISQFLNSEAETLYDYGSDRGSNVHLIAVIEVRRKLLAIASSGEQRGLAQTNLGTALWRLGERESGTAKLEEAAAAYREALKEWTPEAAPHWYTMLQRNMAACLDLLEKRRGP